MNSVFLRKFFVTFFIAFLLSNIALVVGYLFLTTNVYLEMKLNDILRPCAQQIARLTERYRNGEIEKDAYEDLCRQMVQDPDMYVYVLDSTYNSYEFSSRVDEKKPMAAITEKYSEEFVAAKQKTMMGEEYWVEDLRVDSTKMAAYFCPITEEGDLQSVGMVVVCASNITLTDSFKGVNNALVVSIFSAIPFAVLISLITIRPLSKPLKRIVKATNDMAQGDLTVRADVNLVGELADIARATNNLAEKLSASIREVELERQQMRRLIKFVSDGVVSINTKGEIVQSNPMALQIFGVKTARKLDDLIADVAIRDFCYRGIETCEPAMETFALTGGRSLLVSVSPITDNTGAVLGVAVMFHDATEMEKLETMRREYIANISHEFRTPLTAIKGLLEPLVDNMIADESEKQRYYGIMLREVERLSRLITDMMSLSKLQSGAITMMCDKVNASELVEDVFSSYRLVARDKNISLSLDIQEELFALTDEDRLSQIVIILTDNAIKYTKSGGKVVISLRRGTDLVEIIAQPGVVLSNQNFYRTTYDKKLIISVEDTGCGISYDDLQHVFERFYTADKSRTEGSTGLGLSIASQITEKLDETIIVQSVEDKGTCFMVTVQEFCTDGSIIQALSSENNDDAQFTAVDD